jgi:hypothetical protein
MGAPVVITGTIETDAEFGSLVSVIGAVITEHGAASLDMQPPQPTKNLTGDLYADPRMA